jgi:selenocysteine-specific elongation factor
MSRPLVIGTAGHIDHGKSALVRALTGTDPDRWAEEKRRGITIDLGFASTEIEGRLLSFVDVPGHERLVRNMLAGATGIDLLLFVVAADESVMPQTREHLAIARLLGVGAGLIVLTKTDLVDEELAEVAAEETRDLVAGSFLEGAPVVPVSSVTGEGLDVLRAELLRAAESVPPRESDGIARLPIDRAFVLKGFGTVVTGTLSGGPLRVGDEVEAAPEGPAARIRGLQVHGEAAEEGRPGSRLAVNLGGVDKDDLARGMVLTPRGLLQPTRILDATLELLDDAPAGLKDLARARVHHGTAEVMARIRILGRERLEPGGSASVQLRLERPVAALPGDHYVLRRYSPLCTLGGGVIVDLDAPKARRGDGGAAERIERLAGLGPEARLLALTEEAGERGFLAGERSDRLGLPPAPAGRLLASLVEAGRIVKEGDRYLVSSVREGIAGRVAGELERYHARHPLEEGMLRETLRAGAAPSLSPESFRSLLRELEKEGRVRLAGDAVAAPEHRPQLSPEQEKSSRALLDRLLEAGLDPPFEPALLKGVADGDEGRRLLRVLERSGRVVRLGDGRYFHARPVEELRSKLRERARRGEDTIDVPTFKKIAGVTRKSAIPLLERFDAEQLTIRRGDLRVIRGGS